MEMIIVGELLDIILENKKMRFIRQENIKTTICNEDILDKETISEVLNNLNKSNIFFLMSVKKFSETSFRTNITSYEKVRVKEVREDEADFRIFNNSFNTVINSIKFENIVEILAITNKNKILETKPGVNRFYLMDIETEEP